MQSVVLNMPPSQAVGKLVEMANARQGPDNISVIVVCHELRQFPDHDAGDDSADDTQPGFKIKQT